MRAGRDAELGTVDAGKLQAKGDLVEHGVLADLAVGVLEEGRDSRAMRLVGTAAVSSPVTRTLPEAGLSRPVSSLVSVVLPAPFWPTMPTSSPG